jgi:hypothetical protein
MDSKGLFGPYCFDEPINQHRYLDMLKNWLIPELENFGTGSDAWLQQVGGAAIFCYCCDGILW